MREILFRGQRADSLEWIYGALVIDWNGDSHIIKENTYGPDDAVCSDCGCNENDSYEVNAETIGQLTGLTDKNGKKIFEGDIIKLTKCGNDVCTLKGGNPNYYFQGKNGRYEMSEEPHNPECFEVIGNVYDNPELLEPTP